MTSPADYAQRVYAGVLGKMIGVYLGRPIEGMTYRQVLAQLGEIQYYVHERRGVPLIVTDDDLSGTLTFWRALEDYDNPDRLTAAQIGRTWLNYIIENKTILWWGGVGMSTEHTAFKRLKEGIDAPASGSIALNSKVVAEQIGAQIFIDAWAMVAPGDPDRAAHLARLAASVSHDGEAVYAAQVVAAMEAQAFVEPNLDKLLDVAVGFIPRDSVIYRMIADLRAFHAKEQDWHKAMTDVMEKHYGYDRFGGNCHVVPNHGLIILALLYGDDSFQKSLMIANTCGWDTDCNSGNVGCLLGIKNSLAGIDAGPDWRSPVADRLYLPTADGGSCITDALTQAYKIVNMGRTLAGQQPIAPKHGARFHFSQPGSVQGFTPEGGPESQGTATVDNIGDKLAIHYRHLAAGRMARVGTMTFMTADEAKQGGYALLASPTLYPGQTVTAALSAEAHQGPSALARLYLQHAGEGDALVRVYGPEVLLKVGERHELTWRVPDLGGQPVVRVGVEIAANGGANGRVDLDWLTWSGEPDVTLGWPAEGGDQWRKAWVAAVDSFQPWGFTRPDQCYTAIQNDGRGLAMQGTRDWRDYSVSAALTPHLAKAAGLAARVQGLRRYYALLLGADQVLRLVKVLDMQRVLAEVPWTWTMNDTTLAMELRVTANRITATVDGKVVLEATDTDRPLDCGGVALVIEEGRLGSTAVRVKPA